MPSEWSFPASHTWGRRALAWTLFAGVLGSSPSVIAQQGGASRAPGGGPAPASPADASVGDDSSVPGDAGVPPASSDGGERAPDASAAGGDKGHEEAGVDAGKDGGDSAPDAEPPELTPPVLREAIRADYPPEALAARLEANVTLRLSTDVEGVVVDARVVEAAGHGFDEAARAAALQFRFEPARRGDIPIPARFLYVYEFRLSPPSMEEPEELSASPAPAMPPSEREVSVEVGEESIDVTVQGQSEVEKLRDSARAVQVVEMTEAKRQTADLGEVLARSQGVVVRRGGGLGSTTRFSLNGLNDQRIRFFWDGIPLRLSGFPLGVANLPVNLVDHVEIYRGVVPIAMGADALGGAVNLVTTDGDRREPDLAASYQGGSFDTHRLTLKGRHVHEPTGLYVGGWAFFDSTANDYPVEGEPAEGGDVNGPFVDTPEGKKIPVRTYRFHDGYRAGGGNLQVGVVDKPWADTLLLSGFLTGYHNEIQNTPTMTLPYGEVESGGRDAGATLQYRVSKGHVGLDLVAGYARMRTDFRDIGECVYDWLGQCVRERRRPGEIEEGNPLDRTLWDNAGYGRFNVEWHLHSSHILRLSVSPTYIRRTGIDRRRMPQELAASDLLLQATGIEYQADLLDDRLENILFVKDYLQILRADQVDTEDVDRNTHRIGFGDSLRYRLNPWLNAKASYEFATRLPGASELLGDGVLTTANLDLKPETSHNANLGVAFNREGSRSGGWRLDVNGFLREISQLIILYPDVDFKQYQNVHDARSVGVESSLGWTSPGEYLVLDGNMTYQDFRNTSDKGTFGGFKGARITNTPYLLANGEARLQFHGVSAPADQLVFIWHVRYTHPFFRFWEVNGSENSKDKISAQTLYSLALSYVLEGDPLAASFTAEVQNITDSKAFDFYGVQRPGRAVYFKTTVEY